MKVSIIPADNIIVIDGDICSSVKFTLDSHIHAIQWYGDHGEIEHVCHHMNDGSVHKPHNEIITSLEPFQHIIDQFKADHTTPVITNELEQVTPDVSSSISTYTETINSKQMRLQLYHMGLLAQVNDWVSTQSTVVQIEWEYSTEFTKNTDFINLMAQHLQWNQEQIDTLFTHNS